MVSKLDRMVLMPKAPTVSAQKKSGGRMVQVVDRVQIIGGGYEIAEAMLNRWLKAALC